MLYYMQDSMKLKLIKKNVCERVATRGGLLGWGGGEGNTIKKLIFKINLVKLMGLATPAPDIKELGVFSNPQRINYQYMKFLLYIQLLNHLFLLQLLCLQYKHI